MARPDFYEDWPVTGEVPAASPKEIHEGAQSHFLSRAGYFLKRLKHDHEVVTSSDGRDELTIHDHKKEIVIGALIAGATVAGILAYRHHLRPRHKK